MRRPLRPVWAGLVCVMVALQYRSACAAQIDALDLSLEELMSVVVTSVSKKPQPLSETAAAIHVITADEIRRSGATNIPEALKLAPGVQVSAISNNSWAVSIRGFADRFANKLLVLVDGRSVYAPFFSGVRWEGLNVPLESISRIEVIRGPGASVWGANAVNGVINIVTKTATEDAGLEGSAAAGSTMKGYGYARYARQLDEDTSVSVYAKAHEYGASRLVGGGEGADDWQGRSGGFRYERRVETGVLRVEAGAGKQHLGDTLTVYSTPPAVAWQPIGQTLSESHVLVRHDAADASRRSFQGYVNHSDFQHPYLGEKRTTAEFEYQEGASLQGHELTWGLGYRYSADRIRSSPMIWSLEGERGISLYSGFIEDEFVLVPDRLRFSAGARLEYNSYTGYSIQPNMRLFWTPDDRNKLWAAVSRAVRTPARMERGGFGYVEAGPGDPIVGMPPYIVQLGSRRLDDEKLVGLDVGWRRKLTPSASLDVAGFYYRYSNMRGAAFLEPVLTPDGYLLVPCETNNGNGARVFGLEAAFDWKPTLDWRVRADVAWMQTGVTQGDIPQQLVPDFQGVSPDIQASFRSSLDLSPTVSWDVWVRHVGKIDLYRAPAHTTVDMRLAWQAAKNLELSVVGQNIFDQAHFEYVGQYFQSVPTEQQRRWYMKAHWRF